MKKEIVYVLKRCEKDNVAHNNFTYPPAGKVVECPDREDTKQCGKGLHGWTEGFDKYFDIDLKGNFVVIEVNKNDGYVELDDKVKFKKGTVIINSKNKDEAYTFMRNKYPKMSFHWDIQEGTQGVTQTAGQYSTQTAEHSSTQTAGHFSTQTAGDSSTQTAGKNSFINNYVYLNYYNVVRPSINSVISSINIGKQIAKSFISNRDDVTYVIDGNCQVVKEYINTPEDISNLEEYEIFVFGSNKNGNHLGGSAKLALDKFMAISGQGEGLQGKSYALPTLDENMQKVSEESIIESVKKLVETANKNTGKIFLLTKVGCGIAGFSEDEIKPFFSDLPANIIKPKGW